jgi:hypothetical protein
MWIGTASQKSGSEKRLGLFKLTHCPISIRKRHVVLDRAKDGENTGSTISQSQGLGGLKAFGRNSFQG